MSVLTTIYSVISRFRHISFDKKKTATNSAPSGLKRIILEVDGDAIVSSEILSEKIFIGTAEDFASEISNRELVSTVVLRKILRNAIHRLDRDNENPIG